jgi:hypothetical protein
MTKGGRAFSANRTLKVRGARSATVLITASTDYGGTDPDHICRRHLTDVENKSYEQLRMDHVIDHQTLNRWGRGISERAGIRSVFSLLMRGAKLSPPALKIQN